MHVRLVRSLVYLRIYVKLKTIALQALEQLEQMELDLEAQQANHHIPTNHEQVIIELNVSTTNMDHNNMMRSMDHSSIMDHTNNKIQMLEPISAMPEPFMEPLLHIVAPLTTPTTTTMHHESPLSLSGSTLNLRDMIGMVPLKMPMTTQPQHTTSHTVVQQYDRNMDIAGHIMERLEVVEMNLNKHKVDFDDLVMLNDKIQEDMSVLQIRARRYRAPLLYRSNKAW